VLAAFSISLSKSAFDTAPGAGFEALPPFLFFAV